MPRATLKKEINKLTKVIHPKSRKTGSISKRLKKVESREKTKLFHQMKTNLIGEKFMWFRDHLKDGIVKCSPQEIIDLIDQYIKRNDEELEIIKQKHSVGGIGNRKKKKQHASREGVLLLTKHHEEDEFITSGIELPDLASEKEIETLRGWNGELRFLQNFTLKRFTRQRLTSAQAEASSDYEKSTDVVMETSTA